MGLPGVGPPELPDVAKDPEPPPLGEPPKEPAGGDDPFKKLLSSIVGKGPAEGPKGPNGKAPGGGPAAPGRYGTWTEPLDQLVDLKPLRCSIAVPLSWKEVTDLPPSMNFAMKRQAGDEIPAGLAMRVLHSPRTALDYGKNLERVLMQDTARGYTKAFAYERAIDGRKAYEFSGYYKDRGRQIQCLVTVIKADTLIYEMRLTTLRSEFGDAKEVMRRIAKSFAYRP